MLEQVAQKWTRETNWRQGCVLPFEACQCFGLTNSDDHANTCVVVISHDCDLANENLDVEPEVEVIVGRLVTKLEGNFSWGKAPRTLHYTAQKADVQVNIELVITNKRAICKSKLAAFEPDTAYSLDGRMLATLRSWLASRYKRVAFPDAFVNRMRQTQADSKLAKTIEGSKALISFVYFDLDNGTNLERADGDPYQLSIVLVFAPGDDANTAADAADEAAKAVGHAVQKRLSDGKQIAFRSCFAISEDEITISQARLLMEWRLEYMTLKANDNQLGPPLI